MATIESLLEKVNALTSEVSALKDQQAHLVSLLSALKPDTNWNHDSPPPPYDHSTDYPLCQGCKTNEPGQMAHMGYMGCLNSDTLDDGL